MVEPSYLPLAVRAFALPASSEDDQKLPRWPILRVPEHALVVDTETTVDFEPTAALRRVAVLPLRWDRLDSSSSLR